jgi:MerR family transcriptional regulator, thiopeptide resistance regulator
MPIRHLNARYLRIGELAQSSGVSAKALRLYEQRGLLRPSTHSAAGYRLYGPEVLQRLMHVLVLKRSGFSLAEIGRLLARDPGLAANVLTTRIQQLERDLAHKQQALVALRAVALRMDSSSNLTTDELLESIIMTNKLEVDFTAAERDALRQRAEQVGAHGMEEAQRAWPELIAKVRDAMQRHIAPDDASVQELARRWYMLVQAFTGGDAGVTRKLGEAYAKQPQAMAAQGLDPEIFAYIGKAMASVGLSLKR